MKPKRKDMKSKILILLLFCSFFTFGQSVPNTNTFSLQDVVGVVGGTSLTQAFSNSVDAYFDPTYKGSKDRLSNFRNYTIPSCTPPTVTTASTTAILATSATGGGNVTATGGCAVTARGVCWSTSTNPTISNSHTTDGSGTGSFTSSITGLTCGTTYYVRAYATNSAGTAYGGQVSFTTDSSTLPIFEFRYSAVSACGSVDLLVTNTYSAALLLRSYLQCPPVTYESNARRLESVSLGKKVYSFTGSCSSGLTSCYRVWQNGSNYYIVHIDANGIIDLLEL